MNPSRVLVVLIVTFFLATPSLARQVTDAQAERIGAGAYHVRWTAAAGTAVDVYLADRPNAPRGDWYRLVDDSRDGRAAVSVATDTRPYFYVVGNDGAGVWTAERLLPLEGGSNFRDLGGYATADGHRVKWGKLFRSGTMHGLTSADYAYLSHLGVQVICDFRTAGERASEPNAWAPAQNIAYYSRDYARSVGELGRAITANATAVTVRNGMFGMYAAIPDEQAPAYREMFKRLIAGEVPLAFNCTGGKDRAGTAAALILTALGVPRETIVADYALSGTILEARNAVSGDKPIGGPEARRPRLAPELSALLSASDPDYIRAMFAAVEGKYGSVEGYLRDVLGVTPAQLVKLRSDLLE